MTVVNAETILEIQGLKTYFSIQAGTVKAVDGVSLTLCKGEVLGIVGESGSGKSATALSVLKIIPQPPGKIVGGKILFSKWGDLIEATDAQMRKIRGNEISMVFQEPMTSLNPVFQVGKQIAESIKLHQGVPKKEALSRATEMLHLVGIPDPAKRSKDYPHQLSGGMRQRVMIAMALACKPAIMLADEPTTALDVTIQAQVLDLMRKLKEDLGTSIILITHDLGVIAEMAQRVAVMYAGSVVEYLDAQALFTHPLHPYTSGLLKSIPTVNREAVRKDPLNTIPGSVPNLLNLPPGCRFNDRCEHANDVCRKLIPPLAPPSNEKDKGHLVRCWLHHSPPE